MEITVIKNKHTFKNFILLDEMDEYFKVINPATNVLMLSQELFDLDSIEEIPLKKFTSDYDVSKKITKIIHMQDAQDIKEVKIKSKKSKIKKNKVSQKKYINFNRLYGDISELLLIKNLCETYKISFNYEKEYIILLNEAKENDENFNINFKKQQDNVDRGIGKLINFINTCPYKIIWSGRKDHHSTEDLIIYFKDNSKLPISFKSISSNNSLGTLKNIGLGSSSMFSIFFSNEILSFYKNYKEKVLKQFDLKKLKPHKKILKNIGKQEQYKLTNLIYNELLKLSDFKKISFIKKITNYNSNILNLEVNTFDVNCYFIQDKITFNQPTISFQQGSPSSIKVIFNNKDFLRLQINSTNGIGVSPFCIRCFWI